MNLESQYLQEYGSFPVKVIQFQILFLLDPEFAEELGHKDNIYFLGPHSTIKQHHLESDTEKTTDHCGNLRP